MKRSILLLILFNVLVVMGYAQQKQVSGQVTDKTSNEPLPGVSIVEKGTQNGTITDANGNYTITVEQGDSLVFTFVGMQRKVVPVGSANTVNVAMIEKVQELEQVVVTGYQTQKKADLTGAVSTVDEDVIEESTSGNPVKSLQGQVSGLFVETSGAPNADATIRIRGLSTLGNNDPLFIIDGMPTKSGMVQDLHPNEIKSIQVLKDAAASSIYGARASNGVVIIETKQADEGVKVQFNSSAAVQNYHTKLDVLNTQERGRALWRASINDGLDPNERPLYDYEWHTNDQGHAVLDEVKPVEWIDKEAGIRSANTNWYDEISRTGVITSNNLTVSSGGDRGGVLMSLSYYGNKGVVKENDFNRISGRLNSDYSFFDGRLKIGENLQISKSKETPMPSGLGGTPLWLGLIAQPILPVKTVDGDWAGPIGAGFSDRNNPVRLIEHNKWDKNHTVKTFGNLFAELEIVKNLNFKSTFGIDYTNYHNWDIQRTYQAGFLGRNINSLNKRQEHNLNWTWSNTLNYQYDFGKHSGNVLAGMEAIKNDFRYFSAYREEFAIEELEYFTMNAGTGLKNNTGSITGYQLLSYFGKVNYSYADKYYASATLRYDGSSRFGEKNKFGFFPAYSLGWRISNESFFEDNIDVISNLKLRFGWGQTGNQEIANDARFALYRPNYGEDSDEIMWEPGEGTAYDISGNDSGTLPSGFMATQTANPAIKWEATTETNIGADFGFFKDKLVGSFDYFMRETNDILIQPPFIAVQGEGGSQWVNGASVETSGFEVSLRHKNSLGDFTYDVAFNLGSFSDEITYLPESVVDAYPGNSEKTIIGHSMQSIFGYVADGIFQNEQQVQEHAEQPGKDVGRIRYKDLNDDGEITPLDQRYLGVEHPDFEYGLNTQLSYKNFSFSFFFQGVQGIEVYNDMKYRTDFVGQWTGANFGARTLDAWSPKNKDSNIPALSLSDKNNENRPSTYYVENGSYLKLRHFQIGYTLPDKMLERVGLSHLKVYLRGENVFMIKDTNGDDQFTAPDPENPDMAYPRPRKFILGLNLSL